MATYKEIKGVTIQTLDSDPVVGGVAGGSWSSVASMNTARNYVSGAGIATAAIASGGYTTTTIVNTETWNGSSWTEVNDLSDSLYGRAPFGTSTSQVVAGGYNGGESESWDGTNWTEISELNTARRDAAGFGPSNTAGYVVSGKAPGYSDANENWNGSSWTEAAENNTARQEVVELVNH